MFTEAIRLVGGGGYDYQGRLEIQKDGVWGTVCNKDFDQKAATIVCRMLGYPRALEIMWFGPGNDPIHYDGVHCYGIEHSLGDCAKVPHVVTTPPTCTHFDDVGISCAPSGKTLFHKVIYHL